MKFETKKRGGMAMTANSDNALICRLLCASNAAYGIAFTNSASLIELQPYFRKTGFVVSDPPVAFVAGKGGVHGCLIGTIEDPTLPSGGESAVVSFRGTHPPDISGIPDVASFLEDWTNNFDAAPIKVPEVPGHVHAGFWEGVDTLWTPSFVSELQRRAANASGRLYVTGHSKGGAMAHLAGMRLISDLEITPTAVVSFAGARPGTQDFADAYQAKPVTIRRYEYGDDLVPHLPLSDFFLGRLKTALQRFHLMQPKLFSIFPEPFTQHLDTTPRLLRALDRLSAHNYASVGELHYLTPFGDAVGDSTTLRIRRIASLARLLALGRFKTIAFEHAINCGSGYMDGVCPHDICG